MTELSRDARALVARARRRDGPTLADRERLRMQLEKAWHPAPSTELEVPEASTRASVARLSPWAAAALLLTLGFLAPESPRAVEPQPIVERQPVVAAAPMPAASPAPVAAASSEPYSRVTSRDRDRDAALVSPVSMAEPVRAATAGPRIRPARQNTQIEDAPRRSIARSEPATVAPEPYTASSAAQRPAAPESGSRPHAPSDPASAAQAETAAPSHAPGDTAPVQRNKGFAPQPIAEELAWVGAAQEALRSGRPTRALQLVQEHAFRFPRGALAPERIAVQALSLCALQRRAAAREVIANLAERAPGSPLLNRVRRECRLSP